MSYLFIWMYSGGGAGEVNETFCWWREGTSFKSLGTSGLENYSKTIELI
jgi:hypothetical protein